MADVDHVVVGTAGHVDHGKTTLVKALTGVDTDRLPEEKARGITIELGFASWRVSPDLDASIVDVPGHERFVRTMVAGASGIDCVMLVVAADDGVMPQTREHLAVCELMGVETGVIVVTKRDVVDDDMLALVEEDVRETTRGTFLEGAEIVRCSATKGDGLDELSRAVARASAHRTRALRRGPAYLAVDRVFTRPGIGTIATGTLARGTLRLEDAVEVLPSPSGSTLRVRGMEVHGKPASEVRAASRVAVNLHGDVGAVHRGSVLAEPGSLVETRAIHARMRLLPGAAPLERRTRAMLHLGTIAAEVVVVPRDRDRLEPGQEGIVLLTARAPLPAFAGQRLVVRRPELRGDRTIGGGVVADPRPARGRKRGDPFFFSAPDPEGRARAIVAESRWAGTTKDEMSRRVPVEEDVAAHVRALVTEGAVVEARGRLFDAARLIEAKAALAARVLAFHSAKPLLGGVSGAELASSSERRYALLVDAALDALVVEGTLRLADGLYRDAAHERASRDREETLERVAARYRGGGFAPPIDDVAREESGLAAPAFRDALAELRRRGTLVLVGGMHFDAGVLASLRHGVAVHFASHATLTPVDFKAVCGNITRKHAIPLLEWLDRQRVTTRRGDDRVAGPNLGSELEAQSSKQ